MHASYPIKCIFFDAIFTSAKCYKPFRICQPQRSLCFSRTVARRIRKLALQITYFHSFQYWRKYSNFWSELYKPSTMQRSVIRRYWRSEFDRLQKANFARTLGGNSRHCATDGCCAKLSPGGDRKVEYKALIGPVIWEGVCWRSLFAKWDIFANAVFF